MDGWMDNSDIKGEDILKYKTDRWMEGWIDVSYGYI